MAKRKSRKVNKDSIVNCQYCQRPFNNNGARLAHEKSKHKEVLQADGAQPLIAVPSSEVVSADALQPAHPTESSGALLGVSLDPESVAGVPSPLPPKKETPERYDDVMTEEAMQGFLNVIFDRIASKRGEFWKLSEDEGKLLCKPLAKVINKHAGKFMSKYPDELALILAAGVVVGGKLAQDKSASNAERWSAPSSEAKPAQEEVAPVQPPNLPVAKLPSTREILNQFPGLSGGRR